LKSVDFPTLGRPTRATMGRIILGGGFRPGQAVALREIFRQPSTGPW
jgi:hypothetical protein